MLDCKRKTQFILGASAAGVILCLVSLSAVDSRVELLFGAVALLSLFWAYCKIINLSVALKLKKELLATMLTSIGDAVILSDNAGLIFLMNKEAERLTGWKNEEAQQLKLNSVFKIINEDTREEFDCLVDEALGLSAVAGLSKHSILISRDGQELPIYQSLASIRQKDGRVHAVVLVFGGLDTNRESRDRMQKEAALLTTTELLERTGEMAQIGGWELDLRTMELFWSLQTCRIHDLDHFITPTLDEAINFYAPEARPIIQAAVQAGMDHGRSWDLELPMITAKGREILVRAQGSVVKENDKVIKLLGVFQDITERKQIEEERLRLEVKLQQAHKLESIGVLAGGIAHDFNNILTGLFGYIEISRLHAEHGNLAMIESSLKVATESLGRAKDLTNQLITFSRGGAPIRRQQDIKSLINRAATFALSGSTVQLKINIPEDLWSCHVDENQIAQVVDNIVRNAKEAMPAGGSISITAENIMSPYNLTKSLADGRSLRVTIEDNGPGIPEEMLTRIFDPFFSTKGAGRGLGLSLAYSIIKRHEGIIEVDSIAGNGTSFILYLPASFEAKLPEINSAPVVTVPGGSKILLMDDEEIILSYTSQALRNLGYLVECAHTGAEALELYKLAQIKSQQFDLVILDLTVRGGMGGVEALKELLKIDPKVTAIVSSGYSDDPILINPQAYGFKGVVQKPYQIKEMVEVLEKVSVEQSVNNVVYLKERLAK